MYEECAHQKSAREKEMCVAEVCTCEGRVSSSLWSLSAGSLHQSEREEERLPEHAESGRPAEGVLHHLLKPPHSPSSMPPHTVDMHTNSSAGFLAVLP